MANSEFTKKTLALTGVAGEHYVCGELAKKGYIALLTPKNNPLFDVVVTNPKGTSSVCIQVKTKANKQGWKLGKDMERPHENKGLFVVLVDLKDEGAPDFYVYEHDYLSKRIADIYRQYLSTPKRDGKPKKNVDFRWYDTSDLTQDDFARKNNWRLITENLK